MITIIWRPGDMYYGINGKVETPLRNYSGYTHEDIELQKWYRKQLNEYNDKLSKATYLNKVLAKEALNNEIKDWIEKLKNKNWKESLFYLSLVTIEELTKQTPINKKVLFAHI